MTAVEKELPMVWSETASRRNVLLSRLSADPRKLAAERRAMPRTTDARLAMLLVEIDEIVLPRVLGVQSGGQEVARLIVSNRRLIGIETADRPSVPKDTNTLPLVFAARLIEIAQWPNDLAISLGRRVSSPDHAEIAASVSSLRQAIDLSMTESAFDRLLRLAAPQTAALYRWSEKSPQAEFSGALAWQATLSAMVANYVGMRAGLRADDRTGAVRTEGVLIPVGAGLAIVIANLDKTGFAAVLPHQIGLDLIAVWQSG